MNEALSRIYRHLVELRRDPSSEALREFEDLIADADGEGPAWEVLRDLLIDLAYYVADEKMRRESTSYYGPERLARELDEAIAKLEALGVPKPDRV